MLPLIAQFHMRNGKRGFRLWIPLFLLWPLFLPLAFIGLIPPKSRKMVHALFQLLNGLRGVHIEVDDRTTRLKLAIR